VIIDMIVHIAGPIQQVRFLFPTQNFICGSHQDSKKPHHHRASFFTRWCPIQYNPHTSLVASEPRGVEPPHQVGLGFFVTVISGAKKILRLLRSRSNRALERLDTTAKPVIGRSTQERHRKLTVACPPRIHTSAHILHHSQHISIHPTSPAPLRHA